MHADFRHAATDSDGGQALATIERFTADDGHAATDGDVGQTAAIFEGIFARRFGN